MRITIFAAGSRGDLQPCIMFGRGLQRAGLKVLLTAPENFAGFTQGLGLAFRPLRGDTQQIMESETGRKFIESGGANLIKSIRAMRKMLGPVAMQMAEDALEACREADALISLSVFATFARTIAEILRIPLIHVETTPLLPTRAFPAPGWPVQRDLGRLHNRLSGFAMLQVIWQWCRPFVNEFRQNMGLPPYSAASAYRVQTSTPLLGAYSPIVIPHPPDWPDGVHITGYWFEDAQTEWQPSPELEAFLDAGDPPVYVGVGSMVGRDPEQFTAIVLEALAKSGQRGLLLTGWGGMRAMSVPDNVFVVESAPHSWLFARVAAVVHHGGAGTTAEGLRAGVPSVILPFIVDQPFWGKRVKDLGIGPDPIQRSKLTPDKLAHAIRMAVTHPRYKQSAVTLGESIRAEDGVGNAVNVVKNYLRA